MTSVNVDSASRTRVVVRGSFALIVLGQVLVAACGWFFHEVLSRLRPGEVLAPWPFLPYCAAFVAAMLLATAVHEGGHVVVGRRFGWRLARISVALRVGVLLVDDDNEKTYREQLAVSAAGPIGTLIYGLALGGMALLCGAGAAPFFVVAGVSILEGAGQLVIPTPNGDANKLWKCLWAVSRGRGREPYSDHR